MLMGMGHLSSWNSQETPSVGGGRRLAAVFFRRFWFSHIREVQIRFQIFSF